MNYFLIYHLDIYQGKSLVNINIDLFICHISITENVIIYTTLKSQIINDKDGCRYLMINDKYVMPQLLALTLINHNIGGVSTC